MHELPDEELQIRGLIPSNAMHGLSELRSQVRTIVVTPQPQQYFPTRVHPIFITSQQGP